MLHLVRCQSLSFHRLLCDFFTSSAFLSKVSFVSLSMLVLHSRLELSEIFYKNYIMEWWPIFNIKTIMDQYLYKDILQNNIPSMLSTKWLYYGYLCKTMTLRA